jgi:hypothetical protein
MRTIPRRDEAAILASLALLVAFVAFPGEAERFTAGKQPALFAGERDDDLLDDYATVFGVAHNSGDSTQATRQALDHGADVIEVDVVSVERRLYAGHDRPLPGISPRFFRGPPLEEIWKPLQPRTRSRSTSSSHRPATWLGWSSSCAPTGSRMS